MGMSIHHTAQGGDGFRVLMVSIPEDTPGGASAAVSDQEEREEEEEKEEDEKSQPDPRDIKERQMDKWSSSWISSKKDEDAERGRGLNSKAKWRQNWTDPSLHNNNFLFL